MKQLKTFLSLTLMLLLSFVQSYAQWSDEGRDFLLHETFQAVNGDDEENAGSSPISDYTAKFDNPEGWTFTGEVYAGSQCIYLNTGATITLPAMPRLYENAQFDIAFFPWYQKIPDENFDESLFEKPCRLSISHGELSTDSLWAGVSVNGSGLYIYGGSPESRITLTAAHPIVISEIGVWYGNNPESKATFLYSHEVGEYFAPIDVTLELDRNSYWGQDYDDSHDIIVYTTDGSTPTKQSARYTGTPIHIGETTTIFPALISANGQLSVASNPRTFTFATSSQPEQPDNTFEVTVPEPGKLKAQLTNIDADIIEGLIVKGAINGEDITYIRAAEGRAASITYLDLSDATIALDGSQYSSAAFGPPGGMGTYYYHYYFLSDTNYDERQPYPRPGVEYWYHYRNDLSYAFYKCTNLTAVILPKTMTTIGESIFAECSNLKYAPIHDGVTEVKSGAYAYSAVKMLDGIPSSVEKIGEGAFFCNGGEVVTFGVLNLDRPMEIGAGAFGGAKVQVLNLPYPGDSIQAQTFACLGLREINIGEGLKYIGEGAFSSGSYNSEDYVLEKVVLPYASIREIGYNAFDAKCPFIKNIEPEGGIRYIGNVAYIVADKNLGEYSVKDGTVSIADRLFEYTQIQSVSLPSSLESIGNDAFYGTQISSLPEMPNLKRIGSGAFSSTQISSLPKMPNLERIGSGAFSGTQISSLPEMPNLKVIGYGAFSDCPKLSRATLPESLEYFENGFSGCNALWSVTYNAIDCECPYGVSPRDLERIVVGDKVRRLPKGLYTGNTNVTEVVLPRSVEILDPEVFANCVNLEYVELSDNITTISERAFEDCSSLTGLHWPLSLDSIGNSAFYGCKSLNVVSLPEGVKTVGDFAFGDCNGVETLYIASTVGKIGYDAFTFVNTDKEFTITATSHTPIEYEWNWHNVGTPIIKVPAASIERYRSDANWNGSNNGKENLIIPIEEIGAKEEYATTSFDNVSEDTDLSDAVVGDVYVTIGENDSYDSNDGSIVLNSTMTEEEGNAIGGMAPGVTDLSNRFNGLVVMVPSGNGVVDIDCQTIGDRSVAVKIGEDEPQLFTKNEKGRISVEYDVEYETYVYIYGVAPAPDGNTSSRRLNAQRRDAASSDNCVKLYAISVNPLTVGIDDIDSVSSSSSPVTECYTIEGKRVDSPRKSGIYVVKRADGSYSKIIRR